MECTTGEVIICVPWNRCRTKVNIIDKNWLMGQNDIEEQIFKMILLIIIGSIEPHPMLGCSR